MNTLFYNDSQFVGGTETLIIIIIIMFSLALHIKKKKLNRNKQNEPTNKQTSKQTKELTRVAMTELNVVYANVVIRKSRANVPQKNHGIVVQFRKLQHFFRPIVRCSFCVP